MTDPRRAIPRTDTLLADPRLAGPLARLGRDAVKRAVLLAILLPASGPQQPGSRALPGTGPGAGAAGTATPSGAAANPSAGSAQPEALPVQREHLDDQSRPQVERRLRARRTGVARGSTEEHLTCEAREQRRHLRHAPRIPRFASGHPLAHPRVELVPRQELGEHNSDCTRNAD